MRGGFEWYGQGAPRLRPLAPFRTMGRMSAIATRQSALVSPRTLIWLLHVALPMIGLWLLIARPEFDLTWEDHAAHFWLVLLTAAVNVGLALVVGEAAYRRSDARLYLVSLTFLCAAGFLALHALATPKVILEGANAGFVIATPIGVFIAGLFALASAVEWSPRPGEDDPSTQTDPDRRDLHPSRRLADRLVGRRGGPRQARTGRGGPGPARGARRPRRRHLRHRRARLLPALPAPAVGGFARRHHRVRPARRVDGRARRGPRLARLLVGVAPAADRRLRLCRLQRQSPVPARRDADVALQLDLDGGDRSAAPRGVRRGARSARGFHRSGRGDR